MRHPLAFLAPLVSVAAFTTLSLIFVAAVLVDLSRSIGRKLATPAPTLQK